MDSFSWFNWEYLSLVFLMVFKIMVPLKLAAIRVIDIWLAWVAKKWAALFFNKIIFNL